ncbi:unnamed protein product [Boreogadus saida]
MWYRSLHLGTQSTVKDNRWIDATSAGKESYMLCCQIGFGSTRDEREEEEPDADTRGADQLPQDQIQSSQEIQQHDDAENGEPVPDPLRVVPDSAGTRTDPEEG